MTHCRPDEGQGKGMQREEGEGGDMMREGNGKILRRARRRGRGGRDVLTLPTHVADQSSHRTNVSPPDGNRGSADGQVADVPVSQFKLHQGLHS